MKKVQVHNRTVGYKNIPTLRTIGNTIIDAVDLRKYMKKATSGFQYPLLELASISSVSASRILLLIATSLAREFKEEFPEAWETQQKEIVDRKIKTTGGLPWSYVAINLSNSWKEHSDFSNVAGSHSAIFYSLQGLESGGEFFSHDLEVPPEDSMVIFSPTYELVHGVRPLTLKDEHSFRLSTCFHLLDPLQKTYTGELL